MTHSETISRIGIAQSLIGKMIESEKANITPCSNCEFATEKGCIKGVDSSEIGPIYDPSLEAVVCPIQKGVIYVSSHNGHKSE